MILLTSIKLQKGDFRGVYHDYLKNLLHFYEKRYSQSFIKSQNFFTAQKLKDSSIPRGIKNRCSKILVELPDAILRKPGKLAPEEVMQIRKHSDIDYRIVKNAELGKIAENLVRFHNERWDSRDYPLGLQKKSISIEANYLFVLALKYHLYSLSSREKAIESWKVSPTR